MEKVLIECSHGNISDVQMTKESNGRFHAAEFRRITNAIKCVKEDVSMLRNQLETIQADLNGIKRLLVEKYTLECFDKRNRVLLMPTQDSDIDNIDDLITRVF